MIAAYSAGVKHYHRDAHMAAMTALSDLPAAETALSPAEAYRTVHEAFPDKIIISMQVPQGTNKNYAFHAADPPTKPTNFVLDEMVFLPKSGDAAPLFVPAPAWMHITPLFLNLHIHNHDWIALKIAWAALLLLTIAMIVSGCVLLATRRFNPQLSPCSRWPVCSPPSRAASATPSDSPRSACRSSISRASCDAESARACDE